MDGRELVIFAGLCGSGKTTFAKKLEQEGYVRLSIDETLPGLFGRCGVDFPKEEYLEKSRLTEKHLASSLGDLLQSSGRVVLDWNVPKREQREEYRRLASSLGANLRLIYFRSDLDTLFKRITARAGRESGPNAYNMPYDMLVREAAGFEPPSYEGEEVIQVI